MYAFPEMIDIGLPKGLDWPTPAHQVVATNLMVENPQVNTADDLHEGVHAILKVPVERIQTVTLHEMVTEFDYPRHFAAMTQGKGS